jgi:hypothetical protein
MLPSAEPHSEGGGPEESVFRGSETAVRHVKLHLTHGLHRAQVNEGCGHRGPGQGLQIPADRGANRETAALLHIGAPSKVTSEPLGEGYKVLDQGDCFFAIVGVHLGGDVIDVSPRPNRPEPGGSHGVAMDHEGKPVCGSRAARG